MVLSDICEPAAQAESKHVGGGGNWTGLGGGSGDRSLGVSVILGGTMHTKVANVNDGCGCDHTKMLQPAWPRGTELPWSQMATIRGVPQDAKRIPQTAPRELPQKTLCLGVGESPMAFRRLRCRWLEKSRSVPMLHILLIG